MIKWVVWLGVVLGLVACGRAEAQTMGSPSLAAYAPLLNPTFTNNVTIDGKTTALGEISMSGGAFPTAGTVPGLLYFSGLTGTPTGTGQADANLLFCTSDTVTLSYGVSCLTILHNYGGSGVTGARNTVQIKSALTAPSGQSNGNYVGFQVYTSANSNDGGTSGSPNAAFWGENVIAKAYTPASGNSYFNGMTGNEFDIGCQTNTVCQQKLGVYVLDTFDDANAATIGAGAFVAAAQTPSSAPGWDCAFCLGYSAGDWPFLSGTGVAYGAFQNKLGVSPNGLVPDRSLTSVFDATTTHPTKWQFAGAGFDVGPTGTTYIGTGALAPTSTGMSLDVTQTQVSAVAVATGGTNYTTGDYVYGPNGGIYHVNGLSGTTVTSLAIVSPDVYPVGSTPSNPVTLRYGMGNQALTVNFTWTTGTALAIAPSGINVSLPQFNSNMFFANAYTTCTWSAGSSDVGPCINSAISAANTAGGGTVVLPAGTYNVATAMTQPYSGVHLQAAGVGNPRDNAQSGSFQAITRLVWTGSAGATMFDEEPSGGETLYSGDVNGITFDCAGLCNIAAKFSSVSNSTINIGVAEARIANTYWTTQSSLTDAPGTQENDVSIESRSTSTSTYCPTGMLFDGNSSFNVSYNRFWHLYAWYGCGDGIVFGSADNNKVYDIRTYPQPGYTGTPVVVASPGYTMPNGQSTTTGSNYVGGTLQIWHAGTPISVQGFTVGSTLTQGSGNTGTAHVTPVTTMVASNAGFESQTLTMASTTGIGPGMDFSCGNPSSGVPNHDVVGTVTGSVVGMIYYTVGAVTSGTSCTFTWGMTPSALVGTYTITATGATTYNIATPNGGAHNQTGISVSGGVLSFFDVVLPMTGSAAVGDTFTIVVQQPQVGIYVYGVDSGNANPDPYFMPGAAGLNQNFANPIPAVTNPANSGMIFSFGRAACLGLEPSATGQESIVIGDCGGFGASGQYSTVIGGVTNKATNFGATAIGGHQNAANGLDSVALGETSTVGGTYSWGYGAFATDRSRYNVGCWGGGQYATQGDRESCFGILHASGTSAATIRLTADGNTPFTGNVWNLIAGASYGGNLRVVCSDVTSETGTINNVSAFWRNILLSEGATPGTSTLKISSSSTPDDVQYNGTGNTVTFSQTADLSYGGLNTTITLPNTDTWRCIEKIEDLELGTQ